MLCACCCYPSDVACDSDWNFASRPQLLTGILSTLKKPCSQAVRGFVFMQSHTDLSASGWLDVTMASVYGINEQREVIALDRRHTYNKGRNSRDLNRLR